MKTIVTVVGARPQFVKAAVVSRELRRQQWCREILVHTGQHYDHGLSRVFFEELGIPEPDYDLGIGGGSHGEMTGRMIEAIESVLIKERPDCVLVYGDTNSTLAAAVAAAKLNMPIAHVEAGLRSYNTAMPEEINRIVADRLSSLLFCPSVNSVENLEREGIVRGVHQVGDVMYDAALYFGQATAGSGRAGNIPRQPYALVTVHRAENTDDPHRLKQIVEGLAGVAELVPVVLPLHPRTRRCLAAANLMPEHPGIQCVEPLGYLDIAALEQNARVIVTDSGGVQKEAFFYQVPCVTLRDETEWVETVASGWNVLVGADRERIVQAVRRVLDSPAPPAPTTKCYGRGDAGVKITAVLQQELLGDGQSAMALNGVA